jgi:hypothetical protein
MKRNLPLLGIAATALLLITSAAQAGRPPIVPGAEPGRHGHGPKPQRDACVRVEGNAFTEAVADNVFSGTIDDLNFGGVHRPAWVTQSWTDVRVTGDGAIKATATTVYELEGNNDGVCDEGEVCFETTDRLRVSGEDDEIVDGEGDGDDDGDLLDEVDLPRINAQSRVSNGSGELVNACGRLTLHGEVDFSGDPTSSAWRVKGRICSCE